jgi:transcriptional regulator with XRE-family HTH domain
MGTTESAISRLESGGVKPSTRTLERYAEATGHRLHISLEARATVGIERTNAGGGRRGGPGQLARWRS